MWRSLPDFLPRHQIGRVDCRFSCTMGGSTFEVSTSTAHICSWVKAVLIFALARAKVSSCRLPDQRRDGRSNVQIFVLHWGSVYSQGLDLGW